MAKAAGQTARFRGRSVHTLDDKGRLNIPARFQEVLRASGQETLMIIHWRKCIKAYTVPEWLRLEETLLAQLKNNTESRKVAKHMIGGVVECPLKQGRISLPVGLRESCGITKDVVVEGLLQVFEIWDKGTWELENKPSGEDFDRFEETLARFGLF